MNTRWIIVILVCVVTMMGFQYVDTSNIFTRPKLREYYFEKMNKFLKSQAANCQRNAAEIAREQVDSVLTGQKVLVDVDSFLLLPRPQKPEKPKFDFEIDTLPVDPIFDKQE